MNSILPTLLKPA